MRRRLTDEEQQLAWQAQDALNDISDDFDAIVAREGVTAADFVEQMRERCRKYEDSMLVTEKQVRWLQDIRDRLNK